MALLLIPPFCSGGQDKLGHRWADCLETWYVALGSLAHHSSFKHDPGLALTYFMPRSNLVIYAFVWGKSKIVNHWAILKPNCI